MATSYNNDKQRRRYHWFRNNKSKTVVVALIGAVLLLSCCQSFYNVQLSKDSLLRSSSITGIQRNEDDNGESIQNAAASTLKEVTTTVLNSQSLCKEDPETQKVLEKLYHKIRSGEYSKDEAIQYLCETSTSLIQPTKSKFIKLFQALGIMKGPLHVSQSVCKKCASTKNSIQQNDQSYWKNRMPDKTYLWTMDFHGGPVNCDMSMITEAGGAIHAEIDGICHFYGLCRDRLKVIRADNWKEFDPTSQQIHDFELAYKDDPEFSRVDAFICHHPVANCELFLPFNRSIIIHATTRIEFGRHDEGIDWRIGSGYNRSTGQEKWKSWITTLQNLAKDKRNVIAANNVYDQDYIKYFTGIEDVELLPSWCGDNVGTTFCEDGWDAPSLVNNWNPTRPEVMIVPYRQNLDRTRYTTNVRDPIDHPIMKELDAVPDSIKNSTQVKMIRHLYEDANPLRMLSHPAIIILPYQISTMHLVELYRLNIPTFCPSLSLLKRWCREHDLMWEVHYGWPENLMNVQDIPNPNGYKDMDKNTQGWEDVFDYWIPKSDFYQYDHIAYFDSWEHFYQLYSSMVRTNELQTMNQQMSQSNIDLRKDLVEKWKVILQRVKK